MGVFGMACVCAMALLGVRGIPVYFLAGAGIWLAIDASGIHATLAGVVLGLLTPTGRWVSEERLQAILERVIAEPSGDLRRDRAEARRAWRLSEVAIRETLSPVERLETLLHPWVSFAIMPLFALANAGLPLSAADTGSPVAWAVFVGFTLGKPVGIVAFSPASASPWRSSSPTWPSTPT